MDETDIPQGHIRTPDGREYVAIELFNAACAHVREQGVYVNQLFDVMGELRRSNRALEAERDRLQGDLRTARAALEATERTIAAMRAAVLRSAEGL